MEADQEAEAEPGEAEAAIEEAVVAVEVEPEVVQANLRWSSAKGKDSYYEQNHDRQWHVIEEAT